MSASVSFAAESERRRRIVALVGLAVVVVAGAALESFLLPALPHIQQEFGIDAATGALAQVAPTVATIIVTPLAGRFADVFGAKRTLAALMAIVACGGLISASAPVFPALVIGQVLQGFALGVLPAAFVVARGMFEGRELSTASGVLVGLTVVGAGLGVLIAGPIIELTSRAVLFGLPAVLVILGGALFLGSRVPLAQRERDEAARVGWPGAALLSAALLAAVAWLSGTTSSGWLAPGTLVALAVAVLLIVAWILVERRSASPMIDIEVLRSRSVGGAAVLGIGIGAAYAPMVFLVPQLIAQPATGYGLDASAQQIGYFLAAAFAAGFIASPTAGWVAARVGPRSVGAVGMLLLGAGAVVAACSTQPVAIVVALVLAGAGAGSASAVAFSAAASGAVEDQVGASTALVTISRALGAAIATQVVASLLAAAETADGALALGGFRAGFAVAAVIALFGSLAALLLPSRAPVLHMAHP